ncbi:MAG: fumarate hydratase [Coriobacteriales bacterium]|jgi:tartrate/fumarate subfamily iron-sulfur-dependent hydro-lyase alpha chain|nr:fumarate hydratase [Coriobacteriales bacterium]
MTDTTTSRTGTPVLTAATIAQMVEWAVPQIARNLRPDVLAGLKAARACETHPRAQAVLDQLLANARIAAADEVPLCQDTGYVWVELEVGSDCTVPGNIFSEVDAAVARAYHGAQLRLSMLRDALLDRSNTNNNTPAFTQLTFREKPGATLHVMLKGGGSDNASRVVMLPPGAGLAGVKQTVLDAVREKAPNACPPLLVGVGVGGNFDKVSSLAKHALLREVGSANPDKQLDAIERELLASINATGIGPGGLGGHSTALAVHLQTAPCHIAALPVAVNLGCSALRSLSIALDAGRRR